MVTLMYLALGVFFEFFFSMLGMAEAVFIPLIMGILVGIFFFQYMMNKGLFGYRLPVFDSKMVDKKPVVKMAAAKPKAKAAAKPKAKAAAKPKAKSAANPKAKAVAKPKSKAATKPKKK